MRVYIYSRSDINRLLERGIDDKVAIISFADSKLDFIDFPENANVIKIAFCDIRPFTTSKSEYDNVLPEAKEIAAFIIKHRALNHDIVCQCDYGISRSSGCAAAIMEHYFNRGIDVFSDYRFTPNQFVYRRVLDELNLLDKKQY